MMGWTWEVEVWAQVDGSGYEYATIYTGESLLTAIREAREARRMGLGCIRLTWRPS